MNRPKATSVDAASARRATRLRPSRAPQSRDMDESSFTPILASLVARVPGAYAAALVDADGETVDYAGAGSVFDLRVAAAHLQLVMQGVARYAVLGEPRWITVRGERRSVVVRALPDGYALGVLLRRRAGFTSTPRAFLACERELAVEAAWDVPRGRQKGGREAAWYPVHVEVDARGRPTLVGEDLRVEVLGSVAGLPRSQRGFRVRAANGKELTLVREAKHFWYADEAFDRPPSARP